MALQGTLDTFALPDVLRLLATTRKTGQLLVQGDRGNGSLYLADGQVVGAETTLATSTVPDEVLFELLRVDDGSFLFDQDTPTDRPGDPAEVERVIAAAQDAYAEWAELSEVVPSLDVSLRLAEELPEDTATLDRERWRLVVTIGDGATVRGVGDRLAMRELPVLRAVRDLVEAGLAVIEDAAGSLGGEVEPVEAPMAGILAPEGGSETPEDVPGLPSLDDEDDLEALFADDEAGDDLPEPLLVGSVGAAETTLQPEEAAVLQGQIEGLPDHHRALVERAADLADPAAAEELLDELPDGAIDRDLMRRFLGSVDR